MWVDFQLTAVRDLGPSPSAIVAERKDQLLLLQALRAMLRARPSVVLGMGGFVTGPAGIAARLLRKPLLLHEQNAVPGLTNRWLARLASQLMQGFPNAFSPSLQPVTTGNPVRQRIADIAPPAERLGSREGPVRLLVLGGSQGAQALNEMVPAALGLLDAEQRPEVWHQTGIKHAALARKRYQQAGVTARLVPFVEDMAAAYEWADLVIARAGASTVSELATVGLPAILVPYPYAVDDHQRFNAMYLERVQAAIVLLQADLSATRLSGLLRDLAANRQRLLQMAIAARSQGMPQATARVAAACRSAAEIRRGLLKGHAVQS